jgi:hypothetical protein
MLKEQAVLLRSCPSDVQNGVSEMLSIVQNVKLVVVLGDKLPHS